MRPGFFYETVAPLLLVGVTSLICISTLTSDINFYTRLFKIKDPITGLPVFAQLQVALACVACREAGMAGGCRHMLHLVPAWQSSARYVAIYSMMMIMRRLTYLLLSLLYYAQQKKGTSGSRRSCPIVRISSNRSSRGLHSTRCSSASVPVISMPS